MLTHPLLTDSWAAISATLMARVFLSSSMKRACSRMPNFLSLEARSRALLHESNLLDISSLPPYFSFGSLGILVTRVEACG